jgi:hypothetical protein
MSSQLADKRLALLSVAIAPLLLLAYLVGYESMSAWRAVHDPILRPLAKAERDAMRWIAENTFPGSAFAVITGGPFATDTVSEWFPVLTGRISLATVQGYEWLPGEFQRRWEHYDRLQDCAKRDAECLQQWAHEQGIVVTYLYLSNNCCEALQHALENSADYRQIYSRAGIFVYERMYQHVG